MKHINTATTQHITLRNCLLGVLGLGISALIAYNVKDLVFGTPLSITSAIDGATLQDSFLPIVGSAHNARELSINGRPLSFDRKGNFNDGVLLSVGYNIIEVALQDRFGNKKVVTYHVVVEPSQSVALSKGATYQQ